MNNYSKIMIITSVSITLITIYYGQMNIFEILQFISSMIIMTILGIKLMGLDLSPLKGLSNK